MDIVTPGRLDGLIDMYAALASKQHQTPMANDTLASLQELRARRQRDGSHRPAESPNPLQTEPRRPAAYLHVGRGIRHRLDFSSAGHAVEVTLDDHGELCPDAPEIGLRLDVPCVVVAWMAPDGHVLSDSDRRAWVKAGRSRQQYALAHDIPLYRFAETT